MRSPKIDLIFMVKIVKFSAPDKTRDIFMGEIKKQKAAENILG